MTDCQSVSPCRCSDFTETHDRIFVAAQNTAICESRSARSGERVGVSSATSYHTTSLHTYLFRGLHIFRILTELFKRSIQTGPVSVQSSSVKCFNSLRFCCDGHQVQTFYTAYIRLQLVRFCQQFHCHDFERLLITSYIIL